MQHVVIRATVVWVGLGVELPGMVPGIRRKCMDMQVHGHAGARTRRRTDTQAQGHTGARTHRCMDTQNILEGCEKYNI